MRSGIAGIVYPDAFQATHLLTPILNNLAHRGSPLEREEFTHKNIQIGVIGGHLAHSPIAVAAIDGRLNYVVDLKAQLEAQGFHFKTENFAEVILYAYELWGKSFLEHLSGNFALAIIDKRTNTLLLARDRVGKNPLYWFQSQQSFIFSSELKGLLASGAVPQTPSMEGIAHYLYLGYIPQDLSPIKGVNKLFPCHYLQYNSDHSKIIYPYWSLSAALQKKTVISPESFISQFDQLLSDAICEERPSTPSAPFGCFVSGGIGSASVAYYLQRCASIKDYEAYSVAFQDINIEDMKAAEDVTRVLNIKHHCEMITPRDFLDDFTKVVWYLDEPLANPNVIATWRLAKLARSSKVVFSGMGSDELLAGHNRYISEEHKISYWSQLYEQSAPYIKKYLLPILSKISPASAYKILKHIRSSPVQHNYISKNAIFSEKELYLAAPRIASQFDIYVFLHKFHKLRDLPSSVSTLQYLDLKTRLVDDYILQYDRLLTANGLLWRPPFIAQEVVEFVASAMESERFAEKDTFYILKNILKDVFPATFLYRPKHTRKDLLKSWMDASELPELFKLLRKGTLVESGIISDKWLQTQLSSLDQQKASFSHLWSILALELWFRLYINNPMQISPPEMSVRELLLS